MTVQERSATRLSAAQLQQFEEEGYLVVENVLDPERDIAPVVCA